MVCPKIVRIYTLGFSMAVLCSSCSDTKPNQTTDSQVVADSITVFSVGEPVDTNVVFEARPGEAFVNAIDIICNTGFFRVSPGSGEDNYRCKAEQLWNNSYSMASTKGVWDIKSLYSVNKNQDTLVFENVDVWQIVIKEKIASGGYRRDMKIMEWQFKDEPSAINALEKMEVVSRTIWGTTIKNLNNYWQYKNCIYLVQCRALAFEESYLAVTASLKKDMAEYQTK